MIYVSLQIYTIYIYIFKSSRLSLYTSVCLFFMRLTRELFVETHLAQFSHSKIINPNPVIFNSMSVTVNQKQHDVTELKICRYFKSAQFREKLIYPCDPCFNHGLFSTTLCARRRCNYVRKTKKGLRCKCFAFDLYMCIKCMLK